MKLYQDNNANTNVVTGYGDDHVMISKVRHEGNVLVSAGRVLTGWAPEAAGDLSGLRAEDLAAASELGAEILIVGTGRRQRFPQPQLLRPLVEARIGFEFMDFPAACRTYNILVGEGRAVVLGLLHER
ncbi:MAG: Mth938-like domain-containing protein [Thauera sp.]